LVCSDALALTEMKTSLPLLDAPQSVLIEVDLSVLLKNLRQMLPAI